MLKCTLIIFLVSQNPIEIQNLSNTNSNKYLCEIRFEFWSECKNKNLAKLHNFLVENKWVLIKKGLSKNIKFTLLVLKKTDNNLKLTARMLSLSVHLRFSIKFKWNKMYKKGHTAIQDISCLSPNLWLPSFLKVFQFDVLCWANLVI